jgi:transcriptional regulator with XRE-family HTH domain
MKMKCKWSENVKSREICNYLEQLRAARNISQESFTQNVTSLRQYRRYLTGESDIPFPVVDQLCNRLGVQTMNFIMEIETARIEESKRIDRFYNFVVNSNDVEIQRMKEEFTHKEFIEVENRMLFEHSVLLYDVITNKVDLESASFLTKQMVNFQNITKQSAFTMTEMLILTSLLDLDTDTVETDEIADKIEIVLEDQRVVVGSSINTAYPLVLFRLAKYSGKKKEFNKVLKYCDLGIQHALQDKSFYLLDYFYYFSALAYYRLSDFDNYESMVTKCFLALQIDNNENKIQRFEQLMERDFGIELSPFVLEHYQNLLKK